MLKEGRTWLRVLQQFWSIRALGSLTAAQDTTLRCLPARHSTGSSEVPSSKSPEGTLQHKRQPSVQVAAFNIQFQDALQHLILFVWRSPLLGARLGLALKRPGFFLLL